MAIYEAEVSFFSFNFSKEHPVSSLYYISTKIYIYFSIVCSLIACSKNSLLLWLLDLTACSIEEFVPYLVLGLEQ